MGEAIGTTEVIKFIFIALGALFFILLVMVYVFKLQNFVARMFFKFDSEGKLLNKEFSKKKISADLIASHDEKQLTAAIAAALQYHDNTNKQIAAAITAAILHHNNKGE